MDTLEKELIGSLVRQPGLIDTFHEFIFSDGILQSEFCKKLIKALQYLRSNGIEIDGAILRSHIETTEGNSEEIRTFFLELDQTTITANFNYLLSLLLLRKKRMRAISIGEQLMNIETQNPETFNSSLLQLFERFERVISEDIKGLSPLHFETLSKYISELGSKKGIGISSGFTGLDEAYGAFNWNEFIVVGGRPGMGKSTLAFNIALYTAFTNKIPTGIISLDYSDKNCYTKLLSIQTEVEFQKFTQNKFSDEDIFKIKDASKMLLSNELIVSAPISPLLKNIVYKIHYLKREYGIKLLVIDYLQLIEIENTKYNREHVISAVSRKLKELSRSLSITIIATSQLSRAVEYRGGDKRPVLSDLRESGSLEQDADSVWFIYRPEYYGLTEDEMGNLTTGIGEVIIAKNKSGACGSTRLHFQSSIPTFKNLDVVEENNPNDIKATWDLSSTRKDEFN